MRVFLSWSGEESKLVAIALRDWLPNVIQALDPWVSSADIEKGESWFSAISESLLQADGVGIFCLTSTNLSAPWLAFEAGALSSRDRARVATFLYGVQPSDVKPPLGLFQATQGGVREDVFRLVSTLNNRLATPLAEARLTKAFNSHWESLITALGEIPSSSTPPKKSEDQTLILKEVLAVVRRIEKDSSRWSVPDFSAAGAQPWATIGGLGGFPDGQRNILSDQARLKLIEALVEREPGSGVAGLLSPQFPPAPTAPPAPSRPPASTRSFPPAPPKPPRPHK